MSNEIIEADEIIVNDKRISALPETTDVQVHDNNVSLIQTAMEKGYSPEIIEKMMDLAEKNEKRIAQKSYVRSMAAFKKNPPEILKTAHVSYKNSKSQLVEWDYAELGLIAEAIINRLSDYGLYHRWTYEIVDGLIHVSCTLTHEDGHSESVTMPGPPDTSGGKDALKAASSTNTFLQRLTLLAVTGLAAKGQDRETPPGPPEYITPDQVIEINDKVKELGMKEKSFLSLMKVESIEAIPAKKYKEAVTALSDALERKRSKNANN